jgi:glycosyltransferase involved in cell wall biosynthesis
MKVAIVTPTHRHPTTPYVGSLAALLLNARDLTAGLDLNYFLTSGHLAGARNDLIAAALGWGADWLLFIDDDISFPPGLLSGLLSHGKRVIGCNCSTKGHTPIPTACRRRGDKFERVYTMPDATGIEEVDHLGLGVCLIAADALRKLAPPIVQAHPDMTTSRFPGQDRYLFERLRAAGETVWIDHGLSNQVQHWGEYPFTNQVAAQFLTQRVEADKARATGSG